MNIKLDQSKIEQAVIDKAVDRILGYGTRHDDEYDYGESLHTKVNEKIEARIEKEFASRINGEIEQALTNAMEKALDDEVNPINIWGEREGKPITIRAALHDRAKNFWNENVSSDGKPSSYGGKPRWEHVLTDFTTRAFKTEVEQNIINIAGAIKDSVRKDFYSSVDESLSKFFKVSSAFDQSKKKGGK